MPKRFRFRLGLTIAMSFVILSPSFIGAVQEVHLDEIGIRRINPSDKSLTIDQELALGRQLAREYEQNISLSDDPEILSLVDRVGQAIARNSDTHIPILVRVVESDESNVSAMPGGYVYVTTGLLSAATTEAELASALSFGIASISARHSVARRGGVMLANLMESVPGGFSGNPLSQSAAGFLNLVRQDVLESDLLGVRYLYKTGYDPEAAVTMLQTIEASLPPDLPPAEVQVFETYVPLKVQPNRTLSKLFSTHPSFGERIKKIESFLTKLPPRDQSLISSREFDGIHQRLSRP